MVLGGGVGGLTAAHELAERGFRVTVVEAEERFGGKAQSVDGPAAGNGRPLPGEHGFRFFAGFYHHVTDTMARISHGDGTVADHLVPADELLLALEGDLVRISMARPTSLRGYLQSFNDLFGRAEVPTGERLFFAARLLQLMTSSTARRYDDYEDVVWWTFVRAERMSRRYRSRFARGVSQLLVAARPEQVSARTIGQIYVQLINGLMTRSDAGVRVLDGPTNDVWFDPWVAYLRRLGVRFATATRVEAVESDGVRVTGVRVASGGEGRRLTADHYVCAMPAEVVRTLLHPQLERAAPSLAGVARLDTEWMNGLQLYLSEDVPLVRGHAVYYDSPWALTAVSQQQFWAEPDLAERTDGEVRGCLSVIISEWERPGPVTGRPARECTPEEIVEEVWAQLDAALNDAHQTRLDRRLLVDWFLDPTVEFDPQGGARAQAPLMVNTAGTGRQRPAAATEAENLVLAADYVRTHADMTTMESANEAGRRAANAILDRSGSAAPRCKVQPPPTPAVVKVFRAIDRALYGAGIPHPFEIVGPLARLVGKRRNG